MGARSPGPAVDASGASVLDPTANVMALVHMSEKRQDDLREASAHHIEETAKMRDEHNKELRSAEADRINAIRAVDVGAVSQAASVAATAATTLASQVAVSAETLRTQVAATATAGTVALAAALEPIQKDIADLRRAQYEAQGQKTQIVETREVNADMQPIMEALTALQKGQDTEGGVKQGQTQSWSSIVTIIMVAAVLLTLLLRANVFG